MLALVRVDDEKAGWDDPVLLELAGAWENQPPKLREDWEAIGQAIAKEVSPTLYHECLRLKKLGAQP
jgi:hypothetical protein